jgi:hypothetical protein
MLRDSERFIPIMKSARYLRSLFTIKTVLGQSDSDDGRPILLRRHPELPGLATVLGGKIDNIYDALSALNMLHSAAAACKE